MAERKVVRRYECEVRVGALTVTFGEKDADLALREYAKRLMEPDWKSPPRLIRRVITEIDITPTGPDDARDA